MRRAFTLIELLVVMAITAILMGLIVYPIYQSFSFTRHAQTLSDAQNKGRILVERIQGEVGRAVSVRNGAQVISNVNGVQIPMSGSALIVRVPRVNNDGTRLAPVQLVEIPLAFTKMDLVNAAQTGTVGPSGAYVNPGTGKEDPTLGSPRGQIMLPVAPGQTLVRWWIGPRDPFRPYTNPYDGLLTAREGVQDNLFVLYRAEVSPRIMNGGNYGANTALFDVDTNGNPVIDDPRFFLPDVDGAGNIVTTGPKADHIREWLRKAVVQTEVTRYDMVQTLYDKSSRHVQNTAGVPHLVPLVQFRPSRVQNEPAQGAPAARLGEETDNSAALAPDTFTTHMGLWTNAVVRTWPRGWLFTDSSRNEYLVGRSNASAGLPGFPPGFSIYAYDPDTSPDDFYTGTELFDVWAYETAKANGRYPFSQAVSAANVRSGWLANPALRSIFTPYTFDTGRGRIIASFGIDECGDPNVAYNPANPYNLPTRATTTDGNVYTPQTDPDLTGNFYDAKFSGINNRFNKVYDLWRTDTANTYGIRNLDPSRIHRAINLRTTPMGDGSTGPLDPTLGFKTSIVPGTEIVMGPDQLPGANYGRPIRYVRVNGEPGANQYRINYTDQRPPTDYGLLGLSGTALAGFNPNVYDPNNFTSSVIQPQFKAGYIQFNSDPNQPLPDGNIRISYRFQFTGTRTGSELASGGAKSDAFAVDYDSRELMSILLTIRAFPQANDPHVQNVTLKSTAKVRNVTR